jgi:hypothetical protein
MNTNRSFITILVVVLLAATVSAGAQHAVPALVDKPARAFCRARLSSGLHDTPASVYLEPGLVTIRDNTRAVLLSIRNDRLLDAVPSTRGSGVPYVNLPAALQSSGDAWGAFVIFGTAMAWDAGAGISRLFHRSRHFVTITYSQDGETLSETLQLSARDARKLVDALNARRANVAPIPQ